MGGLRSRIEAETDGKVVRSIQWTFGDDRTARTLLYDVMMRCLLVDEHQRPRDVAHELMREPVLGLAPGPRAAAHSVSDVEYLAVLDARSPASDAAAATRAPGLPSDLPHVAGRTHTGTVGPSVATAAWSVVDEPANITEVAAMESEARRDVDMDESKATGSDEVISWERRMPSTVRR